MNKMKNLSWGLVLVALGVIIGLSSFNIVDVNLFFDGWWTLFIIIPSFINIFAEEEKTGNIIALIVGVLLLLACQDYISFSTIWKLLFPSILIIIGLTFIFKNTFSSKIKKIREINDGKNNEEISVVFSGKKMNYENQNFEGCKFSAVFGGIDCNLSNAKIEKDVVIEISAVFGGVDIKVPDNVNVKVNSNSIFGGVDNKIVNREENEVTIYINTTCLFGGVEIK